MQPNDHLHREIAKLRGELDLAVGQIKDLTKALNETKSTMPLDAIGLTRSEERALRVIYDSPRYCSRELLAAKMATKATDGVGIAGVIVHRIRKKLKTMDPPVEIRTETCRGYFMTAADKANLRRVVYGTDEAPLVANHKVA